MSDETAPTPWRHYKIGLFVTGKGERKFLPKLLRELERSGHCSFTVQMKFEQMLPITSSARKAEMVKTGKKITSRDEELGMAARRWLTAGDNRLLIVIDDLEAAHRPIVRARFARYREALDTMLPTEDLRARASAHFLVNMLEAYYFADAKAVNAILGTQIQDATGDVEDIPHPKGELKDLVHGFDEVEHGAKIVETLDVAHVLDKPETCASLRVLFAWCARWIGDEPGERFRLDCGVHDVVTGPQLGRIPPTL
jgi:Domain of unknown function (DUF4276)